MGGAMRLAGESGAWRHHGIEAAQAMRQPVYHLLTKVNQSRPQKGRAMVRGLAALAVMCAGLMTSAPALAQGASAIRSSAMIPTAWKSASMACRCARVHADDNQNALSIDFQQPVDGAMFDHLPADVPQWISMAYANFDNGVIRSPRPVTFLTRAESRRLFAAHRAARRPAARRWRRTCRRPPPPMRGARLWPVQQQLWPPPQPSAPPPASAGFHSLWRLCQLAQLRGAGTGGAPRRSDVADCLRPRQHAGRQRHQPFATNRTGITAATG